MKNTYCQHAGKNEDGQPIGCPGQHALDELTEKINGINQIMLLAFPLNEDGAPDIAGHRTYHETLIERNRLRIEFWRRMTFELTKWGLLGFLGWAVYQLWLAAIRTPIKPL